MIKLPSPAQPKPADEPAPSAAPDNQRRFPPLVPGSPTAQVLYGLASGDLVSIVRSPPGAGKTTLSCTVAAHLAGRCGLRVAVACMTVAGTLDFVRRLDACGNGFPVTLLTANGSRAPKTLPPGVEHANAPKQLSNGVVVATAARWEWVTPGTGKDSWIGADVLIVDEAYQLSMAGLFALAPVAPQVLMVGDPGQIDPVITGDMRRFEKFKVAPHRPAPVEFEAAHPAVAAVFCLPHTYRVGPDTAHVLQPLYPDLPFGSGRGRRDLVAGGSVLPEIDTLVVNSLGGPNDPMVADAIVARVRELVGTTVVTDDGSFTVTPGHIGVVCAHNSQVSAVLARLSEDLAEVMVDTTERWQGQERDVMVSLDPMVGQRRASDFAQDTGRLCVMISRHRAHCTFVTRADVAGVLASAATDPDVDKRTLAAQVETRKRIAAVASHRLVVA